MGSMAVHQPGNVFWKELSGSFPEGNKTLQHSISVFRHIRPLVGKQKEKVDETEMNN